MFTYRESMHTLNNTQKEPDAEEQVEETEPNNKLPDSAPSSEANDIINEIISIDGDYTDPLFQQNPDAAPLRKTDIYNVRILTPRQLTLLYNIMRKSTPYIPIYKYQANSASLDRRILLYSDSVNRFVFGDLTKHTPTNQVVKDLYNEAYKIINGYRSILLHGSFRAEEATYLAEQISANSGSKEVFQEVSSLLARIANGQYSYEPISSNDVMRWNIISEEYALGLALKTLYASCSSYNKRCSITYTGPEVKSIHRIVLIPRDLQAKLLRPRKFFEEIRTILKYNELTGFYEYIVQGLAIPIMCKHEFMTYDGLPMGEVSIQCYRDGKCKYCGQELTAYHEQIHETVSPKIYEIILKFLNAISHNIDVSALLYSIFNLIFDIIKQVLGSINNKDYIATMFAFVCLYLYNIYINSTDNDNATDKHIKEENKITYNSRIAIFLDTAKKYWSAIGWSMKSISNIIEQTEALKDTDTPIKIIKNYIVKDLNDYLEQFPLSVLFKKTVYPENIPGLTATTELQKLWLSGNEKMREFNAMINRLYLSIWQYNNVESMIKRITSKPIATTGNDTVFKRKTISASHFYDLTYKTYCPVHFVHQFTSSICKYCGLKQNGSNKNDVYNKYVELINDAYLQSPNTLPKNRFAIEALYNVSMIEKYKPEELIDKHLHIENHMDKTAIEEKFKTNSNLNELLHMITNALHLVLDDKFRTTAFAMKCLCFITDRKIMSRESVINELYNILFPFPNITYII